VNYIVISQLTKSATSIGANYEEAQGASSRDEFAYKVGISHREAKESNYWLRVIHASSMDESSELDGLMRESAELRNILGSIAGKVKRRNNK